MNEFRHQLSDPESTIGFAARVGSLWSLVGITSWADLAGFTATIYSLILIGEWLWKRCLRAFFERHGWLKHRMRRSSDRG